MFTWLLRESEAPVCKARFAGRGRSPVQEAQRSQMGASGPALGQKPREHISVSFMRLEREGRGAAMAVRAQYQEKLSAAVGENDDNGKL